MVWRPTFESTSSGSILDVSVPAVALGKSSDRESGLRLDWGLIGYYRVSGGSECIMGGSGSRKTWVGIVIETGFRVVSEHRLVGVVSL